MEVDSLICDNFRKMEDEKEAVNYQDPGGSLYNDKFFNNLLKTEGGPELIRDRLAENTVRKIFNESLSRHLQTPLSQLRSALDPLQLFPLEFKFHNDLARDTTLNTSILRVQVKIP